MGARFRSWWQQSKQHPVVIGVIVGVIAALVIVIALIFLEVRLYGTGFAGKKLWDWLQLLIIPVVLAVGAIFFNLATSVTEQMIAENNRQEAMLQEYIDKISELLLHENLRKSNPRDEVQNIARARTLTLLTQLNEWRISSVLQFLYESHLLDKDKLIIHLEGANLGSALLVKANLKGASLGGAFFYKAYFTGANLSGASLSSATLINCDFSDANLQEADLTNASFLEITNLFRANLSGANMSGAYIQQADLSSANLKGVIGITVEELEKKAKSLKGATMPDGSIHS